MEAIRLLGDSFENDVKAEGTKPLAAEQQLLTRFENDVKAEGTKLDLINSEYSYGLRMM